MGWIVEYCLRTGLAFAFLYPPYSALMDPYAWVGFFPQFVRDIVSNDTILLHVFGVIEVIVALWILCGRNILMPSAIAAVMLLSIVLFNWGAMPIVFRDLSILAMAIALAVEHAQRYDARLFFARRNTTGNS